MTFRIPLPIRCDEPRAPSALTGPFRLEEDGRAATLELPEGTFVRVIQLYTGGENEPHVAVQWTLPNHGAESSLYWNGDGSYDGWDWGSNCPPDEPERVKQSAKP